MRNTACGGTGSTAPLTGSSAAAARLGKPDGQGTRIITCHLGNGSSIAAIRDGKLRYAGSAEEILRPEILREIFEIEAKVVTGADGIPYCIPVGSCRREEREKERETP